MHLSMEVCISRKRLTNKRQRNAPHDLFLILHFCVPFSCFILGSVCSWNETNSEVLSEKSNHFTQLQCISCGVFYLVALSRTQEVQWVMITQRKPRTNRTLPASDWFLVFFGCPVKTEYIFNSFFLHTHTSALKSVFCSSISIISALTI